MRTRTIICAFFALVGVTASLDAQYVRIGNPGATPRAGMNPPTILRSTAALYTDDARVRGIEGTVTIEAAMGEDGRIKSMRVLKGLGAGLDEAALASVQEWEFSPATQNGPPVSVVAQIDVQFNLRSANAFRVGNGVTPPTVLSRVDPRYPEEARAAGLDGTVVLQAVVKSDGTVDVIRVVRGLAFGLTDSAVDAIKQWRFTPGQKGGQAVDVALNIEVNYHMAKKK
jgi:TonB family protein